MGRVRLEKVYKRFGDSLVVNNFTLEIPDREFVVLVGPSGCGKSTTLRMIAGLEEITAGEIYIGDTLVNDLPPRDRDVSMVFQNYALFPHMNVYDNLCFGLRMRRTPKKDIDQRVQAAAQLLGLSHLLRRKPRELSGGERQRVAIGRSIVRRPQVFLFDEPLSNLDAKLRVQMRGEIKKLHESLQSTIIYVTHDQIEAMTMANRIVVMKDGIIQQIGQPLEVYERPANIFVAGFIGSPAMNFLRVTLAQDRGGDFYAVGDQVRLKLPEAKRPICRQHAGAELTLGIRPEHLEPGEEAGATLVAAVELVEPLGAELFLALRMGAQALTARVEATADITAHATLPFKVRMQRCVLFAPDGRALY